MSALGYAAVALAAEGDIEAELTYICGLSLDDCRALAYFLAGELAHVMIRQRTGLDEGARAAAGSEIAESMRSMCRMLAGIDVAADRPAAIIEILREMGGES
jgi:hypothetical protein